MKSNDTAVLFDFNDTLQQDVEAEHQQAKGNPACKPPELFTLNIRVPRRVEFQSIGHGRYIYITSYHHPHRFLGAFQRHPFMILWERDLGGVQILKVLVHRRGNFSRSLGETRELQRLVNVCGPHGKAPDLDTYDKVCCMASGVGIAAHLLT
jgi:predicted ferric reductase